MGSSVAISPVVKGAANEHRKNLSAIFIKDFTRYRRASTLGDEQRDLHSFRTGFNIGMISGGLRVYRAHLLMGHVIHDVNLLSCGGYGDHSSACATSSTWST